MPKIGDIVFAKVIRVEPFQAKLRIVAIEQNVLQSQFYGIIRREHARDYDVDQIDLYKFFTPGDIVKAMVLNVGGNLNSVLLSTTADD
jgi:exosome complex component CSL4